MALVKLNNNGVKDATAFGSITALGNLILIKTQTVSSGVSSVSFVNGASSVVLDNTYKEYIFFFNNIHPSASSHFTFQGSTNSGSSYGVTLTSTFFQAEHSEAGTNPALGYQTSSDLAQSTSFQRIFSSLTTNADDSGSGYLHLFEPASDTFVKHFISASSNVASAYEQNSYMAGYFNSTSAIDAIEFKMSSGNIDSATISLYGVV